MARVLGLGDAGVDIIMHVARLPSHDEKILASKIERHAGGVVANFLCALSRLGTPAGFLGCVGHDELGVIVKNAFEGFGVDVSHLIVKDGEETYFCVTLLDSTGEKALVIGATTTIFPCPDDITQENFKGAELLHTTGLHADTSLKAFRLARQLGVRISLDLEPSTLVQGLDKTKQLLRLTDLLFINRHALAELFPGTTDIVAACSRLLEWGPQTVVLTRGDKGSMVVASGQQAVVSPAFSVPVVDTTGAGDCYNAAFVHGYLQGWPLDRVATFANAAAAISTTAVGAQAALPTQEQVQRLVASAGRLPIEEQYHDPDCADA